MYVKEAIVYAVASFFRNLKSVCQDSFFLVGLFYLKFTIKKTKKYN